jgi:hypothetical protein
MWRGLAGKPLSLTVFSCLTVFDRSAVLDQLDKVGVKVGAKVTILVQLTNYIYP